MLDHRNVYRTTSPHSASRHWCGHRNVYSSPAAPRSFTRPTTDRVGFRTPVASLLWLSHDEVETLAAELANPLFPGPAVNLGASCHEMRAPMQGPLAVLKEQHERAKELCVQVNMSCAQVRALGVIDRPTCATMAGWQNTPNETPHAHLDSTPSAPPGAPRMRARVGHPHAQPRPPARKKSKLPLPTAR